MASAPTTVPGAPMPTGWMAKPQEVLTTIKSAAAVLEKSQPLSEEQIRTCRAILKDIEAYMAPFNKIATHSLLLNVLLYDYTENLQELDKSIRELWNKIEFKGCQFIADARAGTQEPLPPTAPSFLPILTDNMNWLDESLYNYTIYLLKTYSDRYTNEELQHLNGDEINRCKNIYAQIGQHISSIQYIFTNSVFTDIEFPKAMLRVVGVILGADDSSTQKYTDLFHAINPDNHKERNEKKASRAASRSSSRGGTAVHSAKPSPFKSTESEKGNKTPPPANRTIDLTGLSARLESVPTSPSNRPLAKGTLHFQDDAPPKPPANPPVPKPEEKVSETTPLLQTAPKPPAKKAAPQPPDEESCSCVLI